MSDLPRKTETSRGNDWFVTSLAKGLRIIRSFEGSLKPMSVSEVAARTGMSRAAVRRFLMTLVDQGYMATEEGRYFLTPNVLELGYSYLSAMNIPQLAQPVLSELLKTGMEAASIAVLNDLEIVYIARAPERTMVDFPVYVGAKLPAYSTSMGHVLLAGLPEHVLEERVARMELRTPTQFSLRSKQELLDVLKDVRERNWASTANQVTFGVAAVAVPIYNKQGLVAAAVNVMRFVDFDVERIEPEPYLPQLRKAAAQLSNVLEIHPTWTSESR